METLGICLLPARSIDDRFLGFLEISQWFAGKPKMYQLIPLIVLFIFPRYFHFTSQLLRVFWLLCCLKHSTVIIVTVRILLIFSWWSWRTFSSLLFERHWTYKYMDWTDQSGTGYVNIQNIPSSGAHRILWLSFFYFRLRRRGTN